MELKKKLVFLLRIAASILAAFFIVQIKLDFFDYYIFDIQQRIKPAKNTSDLFEVISITPENIKKLGSHPKFTDLNLALEKIIQQSPKKVLLNLRLEDYEGTLAEKLKFVEIANSIENLVWLISPEPDLTTADLEKKYPYPLYQLNIQFGPKTSDLNIFAKDSVTRRVLLDYQDKPLMHYKLAKELNPDTPAIDSMNGVFNFLGTHQLYIYFRNENTYQVSNFLDLNRNYKDKIVILGTDDRLTSKDYISTPFSRELLAMTTSEMHANIFDTILFNDAIRPPPDWLNFFFTSIICILTVHIVLTMKPLIGIGLIGLIGLSIWLISFMAFWPFQIWIKLGHPLLSIFLTYYFFIPYRLIIENRRSWEYYQKNKLLQQVEELKSNFISMMSHDLKTPIARIQGMCEVILKDMTQLSSNQREAIDSISASSQDLLKFINAILQYGRIESESIKLHLQNRDINQILKDVIKKHDFLAKIKKIQILPELEPLFPSSVDPELISQVFSNLLENAIKYSPENSKVLITSEEKDGKIIIQFADQGQGIPTDELPNIFMKFFRSKNAKSSPIKGSGLGLYLAKYFTELHKGSIIVESTYGQGSTFTVELPADGTPVQTADSAEA